MCLSGSAVDLVNGLSRAVARNWHGLGFWTRAGSSRVVLAALSSAMTREAAPFFEGIS